MWRSTTHFFISIWRIIFSDVLELRLRHVVSKLFKLLLNIELLNLIFNKKSIIFYLILKGIANNLPRISIISLFYRNKNTKQTEFRKMFIPKQVQPVFQQNIKRGFSPFKGCSPQSSSFFVFHCSRKFFHLFMYMILSVKIILIKCVKMSFTVYPSVNQYTDFLLILCMKI